MSVPSRPFRYSGTGASGRQYEAASGQPHLSPDGADLWKFPGTYATAQNLAIVPHPESVSQNDQSSSGRVENHSGNSANPGNREHNIDSTLAENPNPRHFSDDLTRGFRSSEKPPQSTRGTSTKRAGQANRSARPDDRIINEAEDSTGQILDRAKSNSVETEVIETVAPGKFPMKFIMCG